MFQTNAGSCIALPSEQDGASVDSNDAISVATLGTQFLDYLLELSSRVSGFSLRGVYMGTACLAAMQEAYRFGLGQMPVVEPEIAKNPLPIRGPDIVLLLCGTVWLAPSQAFKRQVGPQVMFKVSSELFYPRTGW